MRSIVLRKTDMFRQLKNRRLDEWRVVYILLCCSSPDRRPLSSCIVEDEVLDTVSESGEYSSDGRRRIFMNFDIFGAIVVVSNVKRCVRLA